MHRTSYQDEELGLVMQALSNPVVFLHYNCSVLTVRLLMHPHIFNQALTPGDILSAIPTLQVLDGCSEVEVHQHMQAR